MPWPLPNAWIGVSVEDQQRAEERIPWLVEIPAVVHFVNYEPAIGPIDFTRLTIVPPMPPHGPGAWLNALTGYVEGPDDILPQHIDWLVCGGESGPGARPLDLAWVRSARDQCKAVGTPFFFKQKGVADLQVREWPEVRRG